MKLFFFPLSLLMFSAMVSCNKSDTSASAPTVVDSFTVLVTGGYGAGKYKVGDTVHIWSNGLATTQLFDSWTGDNALLNNNDWHAWFIMPARNVSFTGTVKSGISFALNYEQIKGRDRLKPVYSYFPAGHKGFVFLLHGTGGSALQLSGSFEAQQIIKELVNNGFGVIITEAEEATTGIDANGDGKLRWALTPVDTLTNVDYVNIRNITDTFYNRGTTNRSKFRYSLGMSNGGAYSAALSYVYNYKAGVSYCAPGGSVVAAISAIPFEFCMQRNDNNPDVGQQGNADALSNSQTLSSRGICSKYLINDRSPLYPQRFARRTDISLSTSTAIFNELKSKGYLDAKNYFIGYTSPLVTAFQTNPLQFPVLAGLTVSQLLFVVEQLNCCITDHQLYSDFAKLSLKFLNTQCL
jgi:hypothetical protein